MTMRPPPWGLSDVTLTCGQGLSRGAFRSSVPYWVGEGETILVETMEELTRQFGA
jgi:hypothetical protein